MYLLNVNAVLLCFWFLPQYNIFSLVHSEEGLDAVGAIEVLEERPRPHPPVDHRNFLPHNITLTICFVVVVVVVVWPN